MIKRRKPLTRGQKPIERKAWPKRSTKPIAKEGAVGKRKRKARETAKAFYFKTHGKHGVAQCQWCLRDMTKAGSNAHHKKPRGEGGSDEPENMVIVHETCHLVDIHAGQMGRPTQPLEISLRFAWVEKCEANAVNGYPIQRPRT